MHQAGWSSRKLMKTTMKSLQRGGIKFPRIQETAPRLCEIVQSVAVMEGSEFWNTHFGQVCRCLSPIVAHSRPTRSSWTAFVLRQKISRPTTQTGYSICLVCQKHTPWINGTDYERKGTVTKHAFMDAMAKFGPLSCFGDNVCTWLVYLD